MKDLEELANVVLKHLPSSNAACSMPHRSSRAHVYAMLIGFSVEEGVAIIGLTESKSTLRDLILALRKLESSLKGLSSADRRQLLALSFTNQVENFSALSDFQVNIGSFLSGALKMNKHHSRPSASQKGNWNACVVAMICRQIWADEEILSNGDSWQKYCSNRPDETEDHESLKGDFREQFAPTSQKADAPGPFGRSLEEVLGTLKITPSERGDQVSAASALRSLKNSRDLWKITRVSRKAGFSYLLRTTQDIR